MNWLLVIVLLILLGNAFIGMRAGFIKTVFSLVSLVLALILTLWISPIVKNYMNVNEKFYNGIESKVEKMLPFGEKKIAEEDQPKAIEGLSVPKSIKKGLLENNTAESYKEMAITGFNQYVSKYLTGVIINSLSFIITFILILILLWALFMALDLISKLPLLNQVNKTAGLLAGLVHGLIVVWLFFILLNVFGSTQFGQSVMKLVGENEILSIIYNNNILLKFITDATKIIF
ncbi:MAG: hypothetical protein H6Q59_2105 [Firmicutes bacterium]|nr:hypothetical protein [Bacillota bacterium]